MQGKVSPMPSGTGSGVQSAAAVTGSLSREETGNSPTSGQSLAGGGTGGARALDSLHRAQEGGLAKDLGAPVFPTQVRFPERVPCPREGLWHRPWGWGTVTPPPNPALLPLLGSSQRQPRENTMRRKQNGQSHCF